MSELESAKAHYLELWTGIREDILANIERSKATRATIQKRIEERGEVKLPAERNPLQLLNQAELDQMALNHLEGTLRQLDKSLVEIDRRLLLVK